MIPTCYICARADSHQVYLRRRGAGSIYIQEHAGSMHMTYEVNIGALPPVHKSKIYNLMQTCFPDKYVADLHKYSSGVVHQRDGTFVGMLTLSEQVAEGRNELHVENLCVHPRYRKRGIGAEMLAYVAENKGSDHTIALYVDHTPSRSHELLIDWYERQQYRVERQNEKETLLTLVQSQ